MIKGKKSREASPEMSQADVEISRQGLKPCDTYTKWSIGKDGWNR